MCCTLPFKCIPGTFFFYVTQNWAVSGGWLYPEKGGEAWNVYPLLFHPSTGWKKVRKIKRVLDFWTEKAAFSILVAEGFREFCFFSRRKNCSVPIEVLPIRKPIQNLLPDFTDEGIPSTRVPCFSPFTPYLIVSSKEAYLYICATMLCDGFKPQGWVFTRYVVEPSPVPMVGLRHAKVSRFTVILRETMQDKHSYIPARSRSEP